MFTKVLVDKLVQRLLCIVNRSQQQAAWNECPPLVFLPSLFSSFASVRKGTIWNRITKGVRGHSCIPFWECLLADLCLLALACTLIPEPLLQQRQQLLSLYLCKHAPCQHLCCTSNQEYVNKLYCGQSAAAAMTDAKEAKGSG